MMPYLSTTVGSEDIIQKTYAEVIADFSTRLQTYAIKGQILRHKVEEAGLAATIEYDLVGVGYVITVKMAITPNPKDPNNSTRVQSQVQMCRTLGLP